MLKLFTNIKPRDAGGENPRPRSSSLAGPDGTEILPEGSNICPVVSLRDYMARTAQLWHADVKTIFVS